MVFVASMNPYDITNRVIDTILRMDNNHTLLYTTEQARTLDRMAMKMGALADGELMERAGEAAYRHIRFLWPRARHVTLFCGPGNNGGDGYVVARKLLAAGWSPTVFYLGELDRQTGDALHARRSWQQAGGELLPYDGRPLAPADIVVDALLGIGTERDLQEPFASAVTAINAQSSPVLALDLPSGVHADSGRVLGHAVRASATLTFVGLKRGLLTGAAVDYVGDLYFADLDVSAGVRNSIQLNTALMTGAQCRTLCPRRKRNTHKGEQGRLLVVGGAPGMTGAVLMAGEAALRAGAGLVRIATLGDAASAVARSPELMVTSLVASTALNKLQQQSNVVLLGPGLGRDARAQETMNRVLDFRRPDQQLVLDADALHCLADGKLDVTGSVMTPHPGEAAALLACHTSDVQGDRFAAVINIARDYRSICVLKGAGTLVSDGETVLVCPHGSAAMASAGTGDVLAGVIAALLGQGVAPMAAASLAVYLHAVAGEDAAHRYGNGMVASDLCASIARRMSRICG